MLHSLKFSVRHGTSLTGEGDGPGSSRGVGGDLYCGGGGSAERGWEYTSAARVVLVGHGADEQCAGYGRHRTKFRHHVRRSPLLAVCKK